MTYLRRKSSGGGADLPIAPLIDCVFLLLVYFMVTSTLEKEEADIAFQLPGTAATEGPLDLPDEQVVVLDADGRASVNDQPYDAPEAGRYTELARMLARFEAACIASGTAASVVIAPARDTPHQSIVRVLDACAAAGIRHVNFAMDGED